VQEIVQKGDQIDLRKLPVQTYHDTDVGPYISGSIVMAKDPDTGAYNCSYNRLMVKARTSSGST